MGRISLLPCLLGASLALPMNAQAIEPGSLGAQVRMSIPEGSLRDALGGFRLPGIGVSLLAEQDLGDGLRWRAALGSDLWTKGGGAAPNEDREIKALHLSGEVVYFLEDSGDVKFRGPYLVGGMGAYAWSLGANVSASGKPRQVTHLALSGGFGWRLFGHLDAEVKALFGMLDPGVRATALVGGLTYRF